MYSIVILFVLISSAHCFNQEVDEKFHKLSHDEFIKYFNSQNFTWKIQKYDHLDDKVLDCAELPTLNNDITIPIKPFVRYKGHIIKKFDGAYKWPACSLKYYDLDQGTCGSCWAFATAAAASARTCIFNMSIPQNGPELLRGEPELSTLDLTCCTDCFSKNYCNGGSPAHAALFWIKNGLVTSRCRPYKGNDTSCKKVCVNDTIHYNANRHFGRNMYLMPADDHEIRFELFQNGPLIATFALHEDFKDYKSGVYEHTYGKFIGLHSVQVIGFGEDNKVPYWLVTNTWGVKWGESGVFRIKRFQKDLGFENHMISLFPELNNYL